ncbi:hypothetical protein BCV69DRAFT_284885 [Microstroma glucosiphilum]|uniref:Sister chromatid cohesion protein DCC1 n=1 Tax=Pseudomicrostroma glucosiphilum TaxID=1684307 RepID=A0A316TZQ7_9BASI|nr:hypothetical protein BCV69DRAFT_284885 [Pseudomicrostroma glucosiphilum]PWN18577.1 hypothetical protein BCV69DRAFT_284885 [Pseudomicrostroma glucosiphilum]
MSRLPTASSTSDAGPSSIPLVTSAPPRSSKLPLDGQQSQSRDNEEDEEEEEEEEEEGEVAYRLLELPDEVCRLVEEAQLKQRESRAVEGQSVEGIEGRGRKRKRLGVEREEREHLVINGRHGDEAVLCTADKTYALREITQSNSLLLCSLVAPQHSSGSFTESKGEGEGQGEKGPRLCLKSNVSQMLELVPVVPRLERIVELLQGSMYEGEVEEKRKKGQRRYTPQEVRSVVQASDAEVQRGYDEHHVVLLDGQMRLLSPAYLHSLLLSLLLIIDSNAYLPNDVPLQDAMNALREDHQVREEVAEAILCRWFGQQKQTINGSGNGSGGEVVVKEGSTTRVALDGTKLARFIGEQLLREASQPMLLSTLMSTWSKQLGDSFQSYASLPLLDSLYLLHPAPPLPTGSSSTATATPRRIEHFPRSALPVAPAPRFQALFTARPSWTLQDLAPFIEDLAVDAKRREALLLRFARAKRVEVPVPVLVGAQGKGGKGEEKGKKGSAPQKEYITLYSSRVRY